MNETFFNILIAVLGLLGGSGGVFAFINAHQKNKIEDRNSSADEWQQLYTEMKSRLDKQEKNNEALKRELSDLKSQIKALTTELEAYKKYDEYITDLEIYTNNLLTALKPLVAEEVYKSLAEKRPQRRTKKKKSNTV